MKTDEVNAPMQLLYLINQNSKQVQAETLTKLRVTSTMTNND